MIVYLSSNEQVLKCCKAIIDNRKFRVIEEIEID